ncbi:MAG: ribulose-phosphate 3-epimerase [Lachnospiraceae bacterium]|nr:ribulose-phosphate 3-epimerase [Lachnospiraceae bacterium]
MKKYLVPSLLSANFYNLKDDLKVLKDNGISIIHLDVMDGMFVPNLSIGVPVIESINKHMGDDFIFDTHLMIEKPERYIEAFKKAGADILTIHEEATTDVKSVLKDIKNAEMKAGISINPETDVRCLDEYLEYADLVLVMSVHPGFGGQKFIEDSLQKLEYLDKKRKDNNYNFILEIDGGVDLSNVKKVYDRGVDYAVAGSAVFRGDISSNIKEFCKIIGEYDE